MSNLLPTCPLEFRVVEPCTARPIHSLTGSMQFAESTSFFADNDLGTGAIVDLVWELDGSVDGIESTSYTVMLEWKDWNWVEWRGI